MKLALSAGRHRRVMISFMKACRGIVVGMESSRSSEGTLLLFYEDGYGVNCVGKIEGE
ncbi:MAG: hypothetical protein ABI613_01640 [Gemmatimonadota bacterium]